MTLNIDTESFFDTLSKKRIMVIGDVMIDSYIWGNVDRLSPEAPVPIVKVDTRSNLLGGAANVALNIKAVGAEPILLSVIGNDQKGHDFLGLMAEEKLQTEGILISSERITTTKFRVIGNNHQLIRVDEEIDTDLISSDALQLIERYEILLKRKHIDAIIIQDYNKGVLTPGIIQKVIEIANRHNIPVAVDPKKKNFHQYKNVALFKPNLKELLEGNTKEVDLTNPESFMNMISSFQKSQGIKHMLVTLSEKGVLISSMNEDGKLESHQIPAHIRSIADVSGAGDTVISIASLCLAMGYSPFQMASISNLAGGLVCESVGVVPINKNRLKEEISKIYLHLHLQNSKHKNKSC